jgi:hypothetical protein
MVQRTQRAFAYLRTSSAANVGPDKERQRGAIETFAKRAGYEILAEYYDAAVSGADPIEAPLALPKCSRRLPAMASERS